MSTYDYPDMISRMPRGYSAGPTINVPVRSSVIISIAPVDNGFILAVNQPGEQIGPPSLCVGAESIEHGVRTILTQLVEGQLSK